MLNLTDNEKREINEYLIQNKPLPDKYRFLLFGNRRQVELLWNGKSSEVTNVVLPFQTIEQVDEPRSEVQSSSQFDLFDMRGRQLKGWTNKLIWGDNKYILSSLKNGPLRKEIEDNGGIKLIYIDPPFDVGSDFTMNVEFGDGESYEKQPNILEQIAPYLAVRRPAHADCADSCLRNARKVHLCYRVHLQPAAGARRRTCTRPRHG